MTDKLSTCKDSNKKQIYLNGWQKERLPWSKKTTEKYDTRTTKDSQGDYRWRGKYYR